MAFFSYNQPDQENMRLINLLNPRTFAFNCSQQKS